MPAADVREFRDALEAFLNTRDRLGRKWGDARWGVYAFYDYDGEPIYVGQTNEKIRVRVRRHLTNQRTDAVAMRILDVFEVAACEVWPLWEYEQLGSKTADNKEAFAKAQTRLNDLEYAVYTLAVDRSRFRAILNEKIPPRPKEADLVESMPASFRADLVSGPMRQERGHADIRIARRAETVSRLAAVARERGEVSAGLRRVLVVQAVRLAFIAAERLAVVEGRPAPTPDAISVEGLVGSVLHEDDDSDGGEEAIS